MATQSQNQVIRNLANVADVNDMGDEITVIGDKGDILNNLYDIYAAFGRSNVSWRTLARGNYIEMTIHVEVSNRPNPHGEAGDKTYSFNQSKSERK